jgi:hypothetical protein
MLREHEIVYRSRLLELDQEFPDLLSSGVEIEPARACALEQALLRVRGDTGSEDGAEPESLDFTSAIG